MTKTNDDWEKAYFNLQAEIARKLGCPAHPNDIDATIKDLKRRAAITDQELADRRAKIKDALRAALLSVDTPQDRVDLVEADFEQIARDVTGEL